MKRIKSLLLILTSITFLLFLTSCGEGSKILKGITLNVDKTELVYGESISLTFTPSPKNPSKYLEKEYKSRCIEYYIRVNGVDTRISTNGEDHVTYTPTVCGELIFWAKYCNHSQHYDTKDDIVSEYVTVTVKGIEIKTKEDLKNISGSSAYELASDIDLGGDEWFPISFSGMLDGKGHTISNFTLEDNRENLGFFSELKGTVTNLNFKDVKVDIRGTKSCIGIVAGVNSGTIKNVKISGTCYAPYCNYVGAVAGQNATSATIIDVEADVNVFGMEWVGGISGCSFGNVENAIHKGSVEGDTKTGGVLGYAYGSVKKVENHGDVTSNGECCGGVVGTSAAKVEDVKNYGKVHGKDYTGGIIGKIEGGSVQIAESFADVNGRCYVGGLFGYSTVSLVGFKNENSVTASSNYVGGIVGCQDNYFTVSNCENSGAIVSNCLDDNSYTGGIGGRILGSVEKCSNKASVTASGNYVGGITGAISSPCTDSVNEGEIRGGGYVAGIAGESYSNIEECENKGNITSTGLYTGGITGYISGSVEICDNYGIINGKNCTGAIVGRLGDSIYSCNNYADVTGEYYTGGYVGYAENTNTVIRGLVNNNAVTGSGYLGGIVGYTGGVVIECTNNGDIQQLRTLVDSNGSYSYLGGVAGRCRKIQKCENQVHIAGEGQYVGGVAGYVNDTLEECKNLGEVEGSYYVGGIAGCAYNSAINSKNYGDVAGISSVGGICGAASSISGCENLGQILILSP